MTRFVGIYLLIIFAKASQSKVDELLSIIVSSEKRVYIVIVPIGGASFGSLCPKGFLQKKIPSDKRQIR